MVLGLTLRLKNDSVFLELRMFWSSCLTIRPREESCMTPENIWELYAQGKIEEALSLATMELAGTSDVEGKQALHAILAWCHYRRKGYGNALAEIAYAPDNQRARECHVYVLAYAKGYTNDKKLSELVASMPGNINAGNAMVIRARAPESTVDHESVWNMAEGFAQTANVAKHDVAMANLLHNCARFFLDKARNRRDLKFALGLIQVALAHYGEVSNWHHRAAACFWMSHIFEKLTAIPEAFAAAAASLRLWENQCTVEKKTAPFLDNLESGCTRVTELALALVEFARRAHV